MPIFGNVHFLIFALFVPGLKSSTEWIYVKPPPIPTITATIKTQKWQLTTETTRDTRKYAVLSVLEKSELILECSAAYSVRWKMADSNKPLPESYSGAWIPINEFEIKAAQKYQSILTYRNVSAEIAGFYSCGMDPAPPSTKDEKDFLTITTHIMVHSIKSNISTIQVLQAGFNVIVPRPSSQYRYWAPPARISVIHTIPPGTDVEFSLIRPSTSDLCSHNISTFVFPIGPVTTENKILSKGIGQISAIIHSGSFVCHGHYKFAIRIKGKPETEVTSDFFYRSETLYSRVSEADKLSRTESSVLMMRRWPYELRMYITEPLANLNDAILRIENRKIDAGCMSDPVPTSQAADQCGMYGFSLFQEDQDSKGVTLMVNTWGSCTFTVVVNPQSNSADHIESGNRTGPLISKVYTTAYDGSHFPEPFGAPEIIAKVLDSEVSSGEALYVGTPLTINCLMPTCHLLWVTWLKDGNFHLWPPLSNIALGFNYSYPLNGMVTVEPGSWRGYLDEWTISYTLHFDTLTPDHDGVYSCAVFSSSSRKQNLYPDTATFRVKIEGNRGPSFANENQTEVVLAHDGKAALICRPDGSPKPQISWTWENLTRANQTRSIGTNEEIIVHEPGMYWCHAKNQHGENVTVFVVRQEASSNSGAVTATVSSFNILPLAVAIPTAIALIALAYLIIKFCKRKAMNASFKSLANMLKRSPQTSSVPIDETAFLNDQVQNLSYNQKVEIDRGSFTISDKLLGSGEFGCIYKGELRTETGESRPVAIKMPRDPLNFQAYRDLTDEVKIMSYIRPHVNVVSLIGACTQNVEKKELFVLIEYCENGSLRDYLIRQCMKFEGFKVNALGQFVGSPGAVEALLNYSYQAANGMSYLAAQKIIHRDLALRNLLLTTGHIVKISDFGMSRQNTKSAVYKKRLSPDVPVPIFWMALESLMNDQYTQKSDVWSFGVVLWEMFSCGKRPYPDRVQDFSLRSWLRASASNRMGPPTIACEEMYHLMLNCWKENPEERPTFSECKRIISRILEQLSPEMYRSTTLSLSEAWLNVPPADGRSSPSLVFAYTGRDDTRKKSSIMNEVINLNAESETEPKRQTSGIFFKPITPTEPVPKIRRPLKPETIQNEDDDTELVAISNYSTGFHAAVQPMNETPGEFKYYVPKETSYSTGTTHGAST